jgi:ribonuclease G
MGKEIIINAQKEQTRIAILEDKELVELYIEGPENVRTIGDIYLGRVRKLMPSIQAAFIDIGQKQDAFLHFSDVTENYPNFMQMLDESPPNSKNLPMPGSDNFDPEKLASNGSPRPSEYLREGQRILVQITKEPISDKGSRVSTDISLAGRFLVLVPHGDYVAVSRKITSSKEKKRLRTLANSLVPENFGLIIRTVAEGRDAKALDMDLNFLLKKWRETEEKLNSKPSPPIVLYQDVSMVSSVIRDLFSEDFDRVLIDDHRLHGEILRYVKAVAPQMSSAIRLHHTPEPIYQAVGIEEEVREAFQGRVNLPSGGYLYIEHTEAMHVIDVNSGRSDKGKTQEQNSLRVNLEAARVVAKHLRLRDLGGIIVVDFIDLRSRKNRKKVYDELKKEFKKDRAVTKVLPMSDFGIIQITRQRLRPSVTYRTDAPPAPAEASSMHDIAELIESLEQWIVIYAQRSKARSVTLEVHPLTAAYLTNPTPNHLMRWLMKHMVRVRLQTDESINPLAFRFKETQTGKDITEKFSYQHA